MYMKSAETIKGIKETADRLYNQVGNLATVNAIFLYDNSDKNENNEIMKEFARGQEEINKMVRDLNILILSVQDVVKSIDRIKR